MTSIAVVYRYAPGGNGKTRPAFFSKELALASFVEAVRRSSVPVHVVFLVDGVAPAAVRDRMEECGEVRLGAFGSARRSYLAVLDVLARRHTADRAFEDADLVWLAEDDYLYEPEAFDVLAEAARSRPDADYFALTAPTVVERLECSRAQGPVRLPAPRAPLATPSGRSWRRITSTTSTFGVRRRALEQDGRLLRLAPWSGAAWDRTTHLMVQGVRPYPWRSVHHDLIVPSSPPRGARVRAVWKLALRLGVNLASLRPRGRRRLLLGPTRPVIAHLELPFEERPEHWTALGEAAADLHGTPRKSPSVTSGGEVGSPAVMRP